MIRDCFLCARPITNGDCDKAEHNCSKCEFYNCSNCNYFDGECKLKGVNNNDKKDEKRKSFNFIRDHYDYMSF